MSKLKCPGCGRDMTSIDVFHVDRCASKQITLEKALKSP
jgi:hypothetical protein